VVAASAAPDTATAPAAATPAAPSTPAAGDTSRVVTSNGYGTVHIGASAAQLASALGTKVPASHSADERSCRYVVLSVLPSGMRVMLVNDSVARIDIGAAGPRTAEGAGIGDAESKVVSLYGARALVRPNKYTGPVGHDIVVNAPGDSTHRVIFETDGKKVLRFHAGRQPAVDYVEGCG
ncbi:MAG: hypothetical protein ABI205_02095, partial [Gemmatimonadaceae bacterium]